MPSPNHHQRIKAFFAKSLFVVDDHRLKMQGVIFEGGWKWKKIMVCDFLVESEAQQQQIIK